jgi:flagellar hook-basal body complex protein FliE
MTIPPVSAFSPISGLPAVAAPQPAAAAPGFGDVLNRAIERVNGEQLEARDALAALASGEQVDLHGTMIALEEAEIALRAMTSVRDRLVGVYEQVINMAI